jgi:sugar phosphate isomerase/epimerase
LGVMATLDDFQVMSRLDVDFVEVLVRSRDSIQAIEDFLNKEERDLIIHAPECMEIGGKQSLIDLAADDPDLREAFTARVNEVAYTASKFGVPTVIHPGGVRERPSYSGLMSRNLANSLGSLDGVLWLENMPRHYHYGDQLWHCNLLKHPGEFEDLLPYVDGVALDIAHAYLSVDEGGNRAIASFFKELNGHIRHIHLSDASYPDNEGLQLGKGDVDLVHLPRLKGLPVLVEIWGGHENNGARFKEALEMVRSQEVWFRGRMP